MQIYIIEYAITLGGIDSEKQHVLVTSNDVTQPILTLSNIVSILWSCKGCAATMDKSACF